MGLMPYVEGTAMINAAPEAFVRAFQRRVAAGLLQGRPHFRSNYQVVQSESRHLRVSAANWWTAINVGLNEVDLRLPESGCVSYQVRYWRWGAYVLGLGGVLGLVGIVLLLTTNVRGYLSAHPSGAIPGLTMEQNLTVAWALVLFWGFVWPWLMIALHKRPLRRLLERLISEVDARA